MRASLIIAAHNEGEHLWKTVEACWHSIGGLDCELIVSDDASTDDSIEATLRRFPQVRMVRHGERLGASPTKASGAAAARGDALIFLDGHTNPEPGAIARLVEDVELVQHQAVITPRITALCTATWRNKSSQAGSGYFVNLDDLSCGWLPEQRLKPAQIGRVQFLESPALIGCALGVSRRLYDELAGFDPHMRFWGVEDLDFGLKCWLAGYRILHDPLAVVGHRFRSSFDNYSVPPEHLLVNQLRMARKNFTESVWAAWVESCLLRNLGSLADHPEGLWALAWRLFEADRPSAEAERSYLHARRQRDEFWYAGRFGLAWPKFGSSHVVPPARLAAADAAPSPSPSPPPDCPVLIAFVPSPMVLGYTLPAAQSTLNKWVNVYINPPEAAPDVSFYVSGAAGFSILTVDRTNQAQGQISIQLAGTSASTAPNDNGLQTMYKEQVCSARLPITVVIPAGFLKPYGTADSDVQPENFVGDSTTSPVWFDPDLPALEPNQVGLGTLWVQLVTIPVGDQFGNVLDSIYAGVPIAENLGGNWVNINRTMNSDGTYLDPVCIFNLPANPIVLRTSDDAKNWKSMPTLTMPAQDPILQQIEVQVGGHDIGATNRLLTGIPPNHVTVQWPPPKPPNSVS